ncbi:MAG: hypothetical protein ACPGYT_09615 [Nitrospirales bacterium]
MTPAQDDETDCELWSREWELNLSDSDLALLHAPFHCSEPECALVVALSLVAIPVTSFIVSGSIVVVGNTVHWLEEQGTCEESMTQEVINTLIESTESAGGMVVQTGKDFTHWLESHVGKQSEK